MSTTIGFTGPDKMIKKSAHRRNDSGELDVFEAARYFSGAEVTGFDASRKIMKEERPAWEGGGGGGARKSLDMPVQGPLPTEAHRLEKSSKEKKSKQPSSPGGKLASFLNSLFSQTSSKKKSKSTCKSVKDEEESPGGRRKRRSSISHFQSINNNHNNNSTNDSKSIYSSSRTGFRTPPPYSHTPTKVYKDQRQGGPLSKCHGQPGPVIFGPQHEGLAENKESGLSWLDEKFKFSDGFLEKNRVILGNGLLEKDMACYNGLLGKDRSWVGEFTLKEKDLRRAEEVEDGGESDSSSDLFELQNYDLGVFSNGLPVYETTCMENIMRGAPIASATL
ncbi:protein BIG GRAIN 1-like E [Magnolia sinica]|uniref:protein BIG GRAIN 1-like E n=1 Tax=Magnolia sinica TaxID=86752 RepID=UPI002659C97C|nr:protein BIG GRAIN 1-like E [Magnolia sinica]